MSYLINNDLIWVAIPKCASISIERALVKTNLILNSIHYNNDTSIHSHIRLSETIPIFGNKETVCIKRDWFERWMSSLQYVINVTAHISPYTFKVKWKDIDNEFIYNFFTDEYVNNLYGYREYDNLYKCFLKFVEEKEIMPNILPYEYTICTLLSQQYWCDNQRCTYEFDISELDKFSDFIENRFGEKLNIEKFNSNPETKSKIIIDDKLRNWVWDKFEKPFIKTNRLI
jgi:hypothetical protein